jgi:predicted RND superfamily exporter protein
VKVVYGPGTFINDAAGRILDQLGLKPATVQARADRAARRAAAAAKAQGLDRQAQRGAAAQARTLATSRLAQEVALRYGLDSVPALNNPRFVLQLVFAPTLGAEEPKPRFAYVFPDKDAALIQARLRPGLSAGERAQAIAMIRQAVASSPFKLKFGTYVVTGEPVVQAGLRPGISDQAWILLFAGLLLVAVALAVTGPARLPLLPLAAALPVAAVTFGLARLAGASLTFALVALVPVLIALAATFGDLLQGREPARHGPPVVIAGAVAAVGLLALLASQVPMLRGFGVLAAVGIALALVAGVMLIPVVIAWAAGIRPPRDASGGRRVGLPGAAVAAAGRVERWGGGAFALVLRRPRRVLWVALGVAVAGWALGTQAPVASDLTRLVPADRHEIDDARTLESLSGSAGQVSVLVHGADLSDPRAIAWMARYQGRMLQRHGYSERRRCRTAELCPGLSLTNVFLGGLPRTPAQARRALRALPTYFTGNVITPDRRTANIGFVLSDLPAERRREVIDDMRAQLDPPRGITARLAGAPVIAAASNAGLHEDPWTLGLAALLAVFGVLAAVYRRVGRALVPLVPALLATGWSALAVWALQIPVNPLSAALGAIMIALGAALATLLYGRYWDARASGLGPVPSVERAWRDSMPVVLGAAVVMGAGFLAATVSDYKILRDFGVVTVLGLALELLALALVLPATVLVAEEGLALRLPSRARARAFAGTAGRRARTGIGRAGRAAAAGARRVSPTRK